MIIMITIEIKMEKDDVDNRNESDNGFNGNNNNDHMIFKFISKYFIPFVTIVVMFICYHIDISFKLNLDKILMKLMVTFKSGSILYSDIWSSLII